MRELEQSLENIAYELCGTNDKEEVRKIRGLFESYDYMFCNMCEEIKYLRTCIKDKNYNRTKDRLNNSINIKNEFNNYLIGSSFEYRFLEEFNEKNQKIEFEMPELQRSSNGYVYFCVDYSEDLSENVEIIYQNMISVFGEEKVIENMKFRTIENRTSNQDYKKEDFQKLVKILKNYEDLIEEEYKKIQKTFKNPFKKLGLAGTKYEINTILKFEDVKTGIFAGTLGLSSLGLLYLLVPESVNSAQSTPFEWYEILSLSLCVPPAAVLLYSMIVGPIDLIRILTKKKKWKKKKK
jgi:hypothetical protein